MILLIDIGNSRIKWSEWREGLAGVVAGHYSRESLGGQLAEWFGDAPNIQRVIVSSVSSAEINEIVRDWFHKRYAVEAKFVSSCAEQAGVINAYSQPQRLGVDRWMAMIAAYSQIDSSFCVISCGSAITLDVVSNNGQHQGGLIMPGLTLMQHSLFSGTDGVSSASGQLIKLANTTEDAVFSGCMQLIAGGLSNLVSGYRQQWGAQLRCVLTGGDGELIARHLTVGCQYEANLVLVGLGCVMEQ